MDRGRIIPCVLISEESAFKSIGFGRRVYLGDPINVLRIFNEKNVDEILVLDIDASRHGAPPNYELISSLARECLVPLTYGGGVTEIGEVEKILKLGVEKVSIQNAFFTRPKLVQAAASAFGSQSIVVSVDLLGMSSASLRVRKDACETENDKSWLELLQEAQASGAGEVLLNFCDRDGIRCGLDIESAREAVNSVSCPVVIMGGAKSLYDILDAFRAGVSGVGVGAMFLLYGPYDAVLVSYLDDHDYVAFETSGK